MAATVSETTATNPDLELISRRYRLRDLTANVDYARANPEVVEPLLQVSEVAPRFFGATQPPELDLVVDPEARDHCQLVASFPTILGVEASFAALRGFGDVWGLDALRRANHKLIVSLASV